MKNSILVNKIYTSHKKFQNTILFGSANILFLLTAFPFISPMNFGFDTQPFALLFSALIFSFSVLRNTEVKLTKAMFALLLMFFISCLFFLLSPNKIVALRSLAGYASLFFITFASFRTSQYIKMKWFNFSVYLYLSVGIIQMTVDKYFGAMFLPRMSTSAERGVTSLAVEPSSYAIICVFLLLLNDYFKSIGKQQKKKHLVITVLLILQIAITYSGIGLIFITVYMLSKFVGIVSKEGIFKHKGKLLLILLTIGMVFISFRTIDALEQSRAGLILNAAMIEPEVLLVSDWSIADRLTHAILPLYSLFYSSGIGMGLGTWSQHALDLRSYAGGFVEIMGEHATLQTDRIMSGWGTAIYEIGIFGLIYVAIFVKVMMYGAKIRNNVSTVYISSGFTILLLMFMAVPLAFPLFSYTLGMFMYQAYAKQN